MPRRRTRQLPQVAPLASVPAFRRLILTPSCRWATAGAPAVICGGLLAATLRGLAGALPTWWVVCSLGALGAGLLVAAIGPFNRLLRGDVERFDDSKAWVLSVAEMYGCVLALAVALRRAEVLHIDAPRGPLTPAATTTLTWIALAVGGFCAGAIATGVATVATFVRQWMNERRWRVWDARGRELVGADAARSTADRLEWLANDGDSAAAREVVRREVVHLLSIASRTARGAISRAASDSPTPASRDRLKTAAVCVEVGLAEIENAMPSHAQLLPAARQLRRFADALARGYWSDAADVFGAEAWRSARLRRRRTRRLGYDLIALAMIVGLIWTTSLGAFHVWFGTVPVLKARVAFLTLFAVRLLGTVRRQGWISHEGYGTFSNVLREAAQTLGLPVPDSDVSTTARSDNHARGGLDRDLER